LFTWATELVWFESRFLTSIRRQIVLVAQSTTSLLRKVLLHVLQSHRHLALTPWCLSKQLGCAHGLSRQQFLLFNTLLLLAVAVAVVMQPVAVAPVDYLLITVALL
jgi:hypothetical protein